VLREGLQIMTGLYWDLGEANTPKQQSAQAERAAA
jgi:hypothetical protein